MYLLKIVEQKIDCNILTFCKAFDSIPDFEILGYKVEIVNYYLDHSYLILALQINSKSCYPPLSIISDFTAIASPLTSVNYLQ